MVQLKRRTKEKSKQSDEYGTPQALYAALYSEFACVLDVCASSKNHKCLRYYTQADDGLKHVWAFSNWCNPPYSNILPWVMKAVTERDSGSTTVMLVKYDPSTKHGALIHSEADEIRLITHRIKFEGATQTCNFPCAIAVFRPPAFCSHKSSPRILTVDYREILK